MIYKKQILFKFLLYACGLLILFISTTFFTANFHLNKDKGLSNFYTFSFAFKKLAVNVNSFFSMLIYPFLRIQNILVSPISYQIARIQRNNNLENLLEKLEESNENLKKELISLKGQIEYFKGSQEVRNFAKRYENLEARTVQILMFISSPLEHVLFIDAGSQDGITTDMVAIYKNCLLGRVSQVNKYWSKVTLITDKSFKIEATCSKTKTLGMLEGSHDPHSLKLSFVDHLQPIEVGDYVLSTGNGLIFPAGFALGRVDSAFIENCIYKISVKPLVNLQEIKFCSIIQKGSSNLTGTV